MRWVRFPVMALPCNPSIVSIGIGGVTAKVSMSVNNAPWSIVRKSVFYPPSELHGHRGNVRRVIKCVPLVTDSYGTSVDLALGFNLANVRKDDIHDVNFRSR
jgi:hypothetical protein